MITTKLKCTFPRHGSADVLLRGKMERIVSMPLKRFFDMLLISCHDPAIYKVTRSLVNGSGGIIENGAIVPLKSCTKHVSDFLAGDGNLEIPVEPTTPCARCGMCCKKFIFCIPESINENEWRRIVSHVETNLGGEVMMDRVEGGILITRPSQVRTARDKVPKIENKWRESAWLRCAFLSFDPDTGERSCQVHPVKPSMCNDYRCGFMTGDECRELSFYPFPSPRDLGTEMKLSCSECHREDKNCGKCYKLDTKVEWFISSGRKKDCIDDGDVKIGRELRGHLVTKREVIPVVVDDERVIAMNIEKCNRYIAAIDSILSMF